MIKKVKLIEVIGIYDNESPFINNIGDTLRLDFEQEVEIIVNRHSFKGNSIDIPQDLCKETLYIYAKKDEKVYFLPSIPCISIDYNSIPEYVSLKTENEILKDELEVLSKKTEIII